MAASASATAKLAANLVRPIHTKTVPHRCDSMSWSHRMDLLVVANERAEVVVHRLNLQRTWVHPAPAPDCAIRSVDWRPGEKIVAVGYSSGLVSLLDVENQHELHSFQMAGGIECLGWTQNTRELSDDSDDGANPCAAPETYLPPLPSFSSLTSQSRRTDYNAISAMYSKKVMNILVVALQTGVVHLFAFGVLPCGAIDVRADLAEPEAQLIDARMSGDFRQLLVTVLLPASRRLQLVTYVNEALPHHLWPLLQLATKHGYILNSLQYIEEIIACISEAWETALLEMDNKLTRYASAHPRGSVSADFLELLIYGYPSDALEEFLTRDLTEKGLKKLGNSIEISYSTIQKLVIKPLHSGILNVCYHLASIRGMARNVFYYQPLLGAEPNTEALRLAGSFLIKSLELQQTIEQSTRDYKLFWCWLYGVVVRLMEEVVPDDIAAFSQQDIIYLAEFLNTFDSSDAAKAEDEAEGQEAVPTTATGARKRFNLERVGQYLQPEPLSMPTTVDLTQKWHQLLDDNGCLQQCDLIYPHDRGASLVQQHQLLKAGIARLFAQPERQIGGSFVRSGLVDWCGGGGGGGLDAAAVRKQLHRRTAHANNVAMGSAWTAQMVSAEEVVLVETVAEEDRQRAVRLSWAGFGAQHRQPDSGYGWCGPVIEFRDIGFYNEEWLSMLLFIAAPAPGELASNGFYNFAVRSVRGRMVEVSAASDAALLYDPLEAAQRARLVPVVRMYEVCDGASIRRIEHGDAGRMTVSGSRKLMTICSDSGRRLRVYETEVDEDEDDGLDASQSSAGVGGGEGAARAEVEVGTDDEEMDD